MQPVKKIFSCSKIFYIAKSLFLAVNASLRWLNSVVGVYFFGQQGLGHFFRYRPLLPIGLKLTIPVTHQKLNPSRETVHLKIKIK
jgi:hypothetical protein